LTNIYIIFVLHSSLSL